MPSDGTITGGGGGRVGGGGKILEGLTALKCIMSLVSGTGAVGRQTGGWGLAGKDALRFGNKTLTGGFDLEGEMFFSSDGGTGKEDNDIDTGVVGSDGNERGMGCWRPDNSI